MANILSVDGLETQFKTQDGIVHAVNGVSFHLKEGETIHFDSETKHKLRNTSDEKCELIVTLYTP